MKNYTDIDFMVDVIIIQSLDESNSISKTAETGMVQSFIDSVKSYISGHFDPNDKTKSIVNFLAPGVVWGMFSYFKMGWLGALISLAMTVFNVDVKSYIEKICSFLRPKVANGEKVTPSDLHSTIESAFEQKFASISFKQEMRKIAFAKIVIDDYTENNFTRSSFVKNAGVATIVSGLLMKLVSFVFKTALFSGGVMVAGDAVNKMVGAPNAIDKTMHHGKDVSKEKEDEAIKAQSKFLTMSTQKKFKIDPSYSEPNYNTSNSPWFVNGTNNPDVIRDMLFHFATRVYPDVKDYEMFVRGSSMFHLLSDEIAFFNRHSQGNSKIVIPKPFRSERELVNVFIDEVARNCPKKEEPKEDIKKDDKSTSKATK